MRKTILMFALLFTALVTPALAKDKYPLEVKVTDINFVKHGDQTGPDTTWTVQATDGKMYEIGCARSAPCYRLG